MKIAVLGWGSLLWSPRSLAVNAGEWHENGPLLPVEFSRIASDGRLTLVIDPGFKDIQVYWKEMILPDLHQARLNLQYREGADDINEIGYVNIIDHSHCIRDDLDFLLDQLFKWAGENKIDAVIWTDLKPVFFEKTGQDFGLDNALKYLASLQGTDYAIAKEYILKAPAQTTTQFRPQLEKFLLS